MKANVELLEGNKVALTIDLDDSEVDKAIDEAFKKIAHQVNVPGFRPGKAPRKLIEARVGLEAARQQALNDSLPDFYLNALKEADIDAIAAPDIEITQGEQEGPVSFRAEVEVRPVPSLAGYQGLQVTLPHPMPTEADIDEQIERMRAQSGELEPVERAAEHGDFVTLDIEGLHDGKPVSGLTANDWMYEVGTELQSLGADFDTQVRGASEGDVKKFTSPVPPNDLEVDFTLTIKKINERKLPDLTDEWANEVSEFESLSDLRADLARRMKEVRRVESSRVLRRGAIEALAQLVTDDVPETLVDSEMRRNLQDLDYRLRAQGAGLAEFFAASGQSEEEFVAQLRASSTESAKVDLALRSLAAKEGFVATDSEVDTEIQMMADQFGQKVAKVRRELERNDQIPAVRSDIKKSKALEWLVDHVEIVDENGDAIDRELLRFDHSDHEGHDHSSDEGSKENEGETTA